MAKNRRYVDLKFIGEGVSSKVYAARDVANNSEVALKLMNPHLSTDPISVERFKREVQITREINHPGTVTIYDLVVSSKNIYLVMELLKGMDLKDYLKVYGPLSIENTISVLEQLLDVLACCHEKNIIHRDLKPQNIYVMEGESMKVKLLDFGISRMTSLTDLTQTGTTIGSPEYMAPELFSVSSYDPRTDLYSLGIIAYEMLTGEIPFKGETISVLFSQHVNDELPNLQKLRTDAPEWLVQFIQKMTSKKSFERYQSANEALGDLKERRVLLRSVPKLARHSCLSCKSSTLDAIPFCLNCGFMLGDSQPSESSKLPTKGEPKFQLWISESADLKVVNRFSEKLFRKKIKSVGRNQMCLMSDLDLATATILRQMAAKEELYVTVEEKVPDRIFWPRAITSWLLGTSTLYFFNSAYGGIGVLALIAIPLGILFYSEVAGLLSINKPIIKDDPRKRNAALSGMADWIKKIRQNLMESKSKRMTQSNLFLLEKYLILEATLGSEPEMKQRLQTCIQHVLALSVLANEIEDEMQKIDLPALKSIYDSPSSSPEAKAEARMKIEQYCDLEEKHGRLNNKLIFLHSIFNSLIGKTVALKQAASEEDMTQLESGIKAIEQEEEFAKIVATELKEVA